MAICTVLFENLYTILRQKGPRRQKITNFSFKMFSSKTTVELTFTTQKAKVCSPWTASSVFDWEYLF